MTDSAAGDYGSRHSVGRECCNSQPCAVAEGWWLEIAEKHDRGADLQKQIC